MAPITWQANPWFNSENPIKMSCLYMYEDTAGRCMTTIYTWLTDISSFWIISIYIGHSAGLAGIITDMRDFKTILVTNLFWVTTWSPSVSRWRVPFCYTVQSWTSQPSSTLNCVAEGNILSLKINSLGWICASSWKIKNQIKKQHRNKDISESLVFSS